MPTLKVRSCICAEAVKDRPVTAIAAIAAPTTARRIGLPNDFDMRDFLANLISMSLPSLATAAS